MKTCFLRIIAGLVLSVFGSDEAVASYPNNINDKYDEFPLKGQLSFRPGVTTWRVSEPFINLWLVAPVSSYQMPDGRWDGILLTYKQRNSRPFDSTVFGFGNGWEANFLSYFEYTNTPNNGFPFTLLNYYAPSGGSRDYVPDGLTKDINSNSTVSYQTNASGQVNFTISNPDGSKEFYNSVYKISWNTPYRAFLSYKLDPTGRTNMSCSYNLSGSVLQLVTLSLGDNRNWTLTYHPTYTYFINQITDPFNRSVTFTPAFLNYGNGLTLGSIARATTDTFQYDSQGLGLVTTLVTAYGTNTFAATTNSFPPYNLGGNNAINRSITATVPDGNHEMYLYRDQSTYISAIIATPLIPSSYPASDVPNTLPLSNTFDNSSMDARNSFYWNQKQCSPLPASLFSSGDFSYLNTTNFYNIARLRHWLRDYNNAAVVTKFLSVQREAGVDTNSVGGKIWLDYAGKTNFWGSRGTNASTLFTAVVWPDTTSAFRYVERNPLEWGTRVISTYGQGTVSFRTNTFTYAANNIDLIQSTGPNGESISSNSFNASHQLTSTYNATNELTTFTYDANSRLLTQQNHPNGLINQYTRDGTGYLTISLDYDQDLQHPLRTNSVTFQNGLIGSQTDARGMTVSYTYDNWLNILTTQYPEGAVSNVYSTLSLAESRSPLNNTNDFAYDAMGRMVQRTDPCGCTTQFGYAVNFLSQLTNGIGQVASLTYDAHGNLATKVYQDGSKDSFYYDYFGRLTTTVDPAGHNVTNYYNNQGLLTAVSNVVGRLAVYQYDNEDRLTNAVDVNGLSTAYQYDLLGRMSNITYPDTSFETFQYTTAGLITHTNRLGKLEYMLHNSSGDLLTYTNANGEITSYAYSPGRDLTQITDPKGHLTTFQYDYHGRVTNKIDGLGNSVFHATYDSDGRVTNTWSPAFGSIGYSYNQDGSLTNKTLPDNSNITYSYDHAHHLTSVTDPVGNTSFTYTPFGDLASEIGPWPSSTVSYSYTTNHFQAGITLNTPNSSAFTEAFTYDSADRIQSVQSPAGTFGYSFNLYTPVAITLPGQGLITNVLDSVYRIQTRSLKSSNGTVIDSHGYSYLPGGVLSRHACLNANYTDYTYDNQGQLRTALGHEANGAARINEQFGYSYDLAGNLLQRTNNSFLQTFNANAANEITSISRANALTVAGLVFGSPTSVTVNGSASTIYGDGSFGGPLISLLDGNNAFTAIAQDARGRLATNSATMFLPATPVYQYDLNGNLTSDGIHTFSYTGENSLASITYAGYWKTDFTYDGLQRLRVLKQSTWLNNAWVVTNQVSYVYDRGLVVQERDTNNVPIATYVRGIDNSGTFQGAGGIGGLLARVDRQTGVAAYYFSDLGGNISTLVNQQQAVVARYLYDPFGNSIGRGGPLADVNRYQFSSKEIYPKIGIYSFGLRFYDPNTQRWLNRDPIGERGGVNLYSYLGNRAIVGIDPWGLDFLFTTDWSITLRYGDMIRYIESKWISYISSFSRIAGGMMGSGPAVDPIYRTEKTWSYVYSAPDQYRDRTHDLKWLLDLMAKEEVDSKKMAYAMEGRGVQDDTGALVVGTLVGAAAKVTVGAVAATAPIVARLFGDAAETVATPYGPAVQSMTAEARAALSQVENGATLYKGGVLGRSETGASQFLSLENPLNPGYAGRYGIPPQNANFEFILTGRVQPGASVITRPAPGIPPNPGGGIEAVTTPGSFRIDSFHMP